MFCYKCGKEIDNEAVICPFCGCQQKAMRVVKDSPSIIYFLLGLFLFPIGLILYFINRKDAPSKANSALNGVKVYLIIFVIAFIWMQFFANRM